MICASEKHGAMASLSIISGWTKHHQWLDYALFTEKCRLKVIWVDVVFPIFCVPWR